MKMPSRLELLPGVFLTAVQTDQFKSSYWSLRLLRPLTEETAGENALLPRVLRRGTEACPDQERLAAALDEMYGGVVEPVVGKRGDVHCFGFVASFLDDALVPDGTPLVERAASLLGDLLLHPAAQDGCLREDYVAGERENLLSEIRSQINDKRSYALIRLTEEMCAGEPYRINRLGAPDRVAAIDALALEGYYRGLLDSARIELYYCGSADPEQAAEAWRAALADLPRGQVASLPETVQRPVDRVRRVSDRLEVTQGKLAMGFRTGIDLTSPDYPALVVANAVFGGSSNSKLFLHVREQLSLCYYVSSALDKYKGLMVVQAGAEFDQLDRVESEVLAQLERVRRGDFTDEELQAAKKVLVRTYRSSLDVQSQLEDFWLGQNLAGLDFGPEGLAAQVEQVDAKQVVEAAKRLRLDTVYRLLGPEGREEDAR